MQGSQKSRPSTLRLGSWLPADQEALEAWLRDFALRAEAKPAPLHPIIEEFADLIADDPIVRMYVTEMIGQVPRAGRYRSHHLTSVEQLLRLLNGLLRYAPEFGASVFVGCPMDAILDWSMGTRAGFAAFRHPPINAMIRKILGVWCGFLESEDSLYVINDTPNGWKCPEAQALTRIAEFEHDPTDRFWGFHSWNDFFTRRFRAGARPVAAPDDDRVVVSACESTPYNIATGVKSRDSFWIKAQPYSLNDMLASAESAAVFDGGTVYQAYLSAFDYHRWHSPVSGRIIEARNVAGTYFSEADANGEDPFGPTNSQGYITHVAARAVIVIEADDLAIGRLAVVSVGMGEISSCLIDPRIQPGARIKKGDELGCFQYGGSTYCIVFRPGAVAAFALAAIPEPQNADRRPMFVNAFLARAGE